MPRVEERIINIRIAYERLLRFFSFDRNFPGKKETLKIQTVRREATSFLPTLRNRLKPIELSPTQQIQNKRILAFSQALRHSYRYTLVRKHVYR